MEEDRKEEPKRAISYIRFSTPEQRQGSSQRRQLEATEKYCKENGYILDRKLSDLGASAFHGVHKKKGALGEFLKLVNEGKIPTGTVLIVESLDRLSRENVDVALSQFSDIIRADISILTLEDRMMYSKESLRTNWSQFITAITYMANAWGGSKFKSDRLKAVWGFKRQNAEKKKLTRICPEWLKYSEVKDEFVPVNDRAFPTIELIFRMKYYDKKNELQIAQHLNSMDESLIWIPLNNRKKSSGWLDSYIKKILRNREVIGEFTTHRKVDGKRIPVETIQNYFPHAISEDLFNLVQNFMYERGIERGRGGGKTGKAWNLFKNVVKCALCGSPMHYIDKGSSPKGGVYLHCDASRRKVTNLKCEATPIRYDEFERIFFNKFDEETQQILTNVLPNQTDNARHIIEIDIKIQSNKHAIRVSEDKREKWAQRVADPTANKKNTELYERLMIKEKNRIIDPLEEENKNLIKLKEQLEGQRPQTLEKINIIRDIYDLLGDVENEDKRSDLRHRLNVEISRMFEWIKIHPLIEEYVKYREIEPGVVQIMHSKYIDKITYKLKNTPLPKGRSHGVMLIKNYVDIENGVLADFLSTRIFT